MTNLNKRGQSMVTITGGAGFIGSNLARYLLAQGSRVCVVDNFSYGKRENLEFVAREGYESNFELCEVDIRDYQSLVNATKGSSVIFHMAALGSVPASVERPDEANEINITGSLNVLRAAHQNKIARVVVSSSAAIYGNDPVLPKVETMLPCPESPYATNKITMEYYAANFTKDYGVKTAILRYFNVFGEHQDPTSQYAAAIPIFVSKLLAGEAPIIFGDGEQTRDFVHVSDVIKANLLAAKADPKSCGIPINVAGGKSITVNELLEIIKNLLKSEIEPIYKDERAGDVKHSLASVERAKELLGFESRISVKDGLASSIEWYKENLSPKQ